MSRKKNLLLVVLQAASHNHQLLLIDYVYIHSFVITPNLNSFYLTLTLIYRLTANHKNTDDLINLVNRNNCLIKSKTQEISYRLRYHFAETTIDVITIDYNVTLN